MQVNGKIVVYNQEWTDYLGGYRYRTEGATRAADLGAVGALIRSVTDFSLYSPHTGSQVHQSCRACINRGLPHYPFTFC